MFAIARKPKSIEAEAYRRLRSNIEYSSFDDKYKVIVVTSSFPGEGKSTTAVSYTHLTLPTTLPV